jgi:regulator of sigma E protease
LTFLVAIFGLTFLILIHEAGHFFVARAVGMRPRRFYIFFPPPLVKRVRNGIEYGIGSIPLGGYVKIPGMHRPAAGDLEAHLERARTEAPWLEKWMVPAGEALDQERLDDARARIESLRAALARAELSEPARRSADRAITDLDDALSPDAYWRAAAWKKIAVIFAGPATNLVFAVAALAVVFTIGVPVESRVQEVQSGSPAAEAGVRPGDRIVEIDGKAVTPVLTERLPVRIATSRGDPITVTVERGGERRVLGPVAPRRQDGAWRIGVTRRYEEESFGGVESARMALRETWAITLATGSVLGRIFTQEGRREVSSTVGIVEGSSQAVAAGWDVYLRILALISLSLALLNMLPLLPLDGGHIAFSIVEAIRGRAIPRVAYERASAVGIALVLVLFFIGLNNDVSRLSG